MVTHTILRDGAIGEAREALLDEQGRTIALRVLRWSEAGRRARWGETYVGRVQHVDKRVRGAFVDLGLRDELGFLPISAAMRTPNVGAMIAVAVTREAVRAKSPVVKVLGESVDGPPRRLTQPDIDQDLAAAGPADADTRARLDAALDAVAAQVAFLPGGGAIIIEPTSALVAIDVDAQGRTGPSDAERFALDLNVAAGVEALRQLRLRNLGGLIAIDFVSMRARQNQTALEDAMKAAAKADPWGLQCARLSRFGVMEMARGQLLTPLHEVMEGAMLETSALAALRAVESAAATARGRIVEAHMAPAVAAWLNEAHIPWRAALEARIGVRWRLVEKPDALIGHREIVLT